MIEEQNGMKVDIDIAGLTDAATRRAICVKLGIDQRLANKNKTFLLSVYQRLRDLNIKWGGEGIETIEKG